jgi:hypothetical protein
VEALSYCGHIRPFNILYKARNRSKTNCVRGGSQNYLYLGKVPKMPGLAICTAPRLLGSFWLGYELIDTNSWR